MVDGQIMGSLEQIVILHLASTDFEPRKMEYVLLLRAIHGMER